MTEATNTLKALSDAWGKLCDKLFAEREALHRMYQNNAAHEDIEVKRQAIASLENRLSTVERLMEKC